MHDFLRIGVIAEEAEEGIVREFFELWKTPWEFYNPANQYKVVISTHGEVPESEAKLLVIFGAEKNRFDFERNTDPRSLRNNFVLNYLDNDLPVYCGILGFSSSSRPWLKVKETGEAAGIELREGDKRVLRIGIDLFKEVNFLLTRGQPIEYAHIPTLEIYGTIIRDWILGSGIPLIEIPPAPYGYDFCCCLTHDVDFGGIRNHFFDRTMAGFVYRALIKSVVDVLKGRASGRKWRKNWEALLKLPGVYLGLTKDFWLDFDRYLEMENGLGGTYFFIPFKNYPEQGKSGEANSVRACKYDVMKLREEIEKLQSHGCEIGLHGIDAWRDAERGREELERIQEVKKESGVGVRMHWLYFDPASPQVLDQSGFGYDSTVGYNDAVGYRAGTTQVFRPPGTRDILELPLHLQDTALFYPDRMNLPPKLALAKVEQLIQNTQKYGGVLTINWHQRSLSPERLWDHFYAELLELLKGKRVWFGTAQQVVQWFRKRRSVSMDPAESWGQLMQRSLDDPASSVEPELYVRVHQPRHRVSRGEKIL
jgi:hypothetical protein